MTSSHGPVVKLTKMVSLRFSHSFWVGYSIRQPPVPARHFSREAS